MRFLVVVFFIPFFLQAQMQQADTSLITASKQLLLAAKTGEPVEPYVQFFAGISFQQLKEELSTDAEAKAFWLNMYNAYTQVLLQQHPEAYKQRNRFFKHSQINIAGKKLSLDFIEHHIIRCGEWKWAFGYIQLPFPSKLAKDLRLSSKDYRIHFALNCGAKSCPPIAFYDAAKIDEQLALAEKAFVRNDAVYDAKKNAVAVSKIFSWFRGDFGGKKGIRKLLVDHNIIPADTKVKLKFKTYDWALMLKAF